MICEKCNEYEAQYDAPGRWCSKCWNAWWFNPDFTLKGMTPAQKENARPALFVARAFHELGDETSDKKVLKYIMQDLSKGSVNPQQVQKAIQEWHKNS